MAEVVLENATKTYPGDVVGIEDVDSGKSTALRLIAGLEEITVGNVYIGGRLVNDVPPKDRDIAMVFQNYALYPHMSVYNNMAFGLKLRRFPKAEISQRVENAAGPEPFPAVSGRESRSAAPSSASPKPFFSTSL